MKTLSIPSIHKAALAAPFFATLLLPMGVSAQTSVPAVKQTPPAPGPSRPFQLQRRTHYVLPNGVQVNLLKYGSVPKVSIQVRVAAGAINLDAQHTGLSALTADLMDEGTATMSGADIARAAAGMGGALSTSGGIYSSTFYLDVLGESAAPAVALLGDVVQHPAFPVKDLERLRADQLREIATSMADPGFLARKKYAELMYGDQPNGRLLPTEAMVKSFTLADVKKYYDANFGGERTTIYVVGQFDEATVRAAIGTSFGSWKKGPAVEQPMQKVMPGAKFALVPQPGAAQSNVTYGIEVADVSSADTIPLDVMDSILGGSFGSRITSNIRESKGYTYSPFSSVTKNYKAATWQESAAITTVSTGPAIQEIGNEIKRLQTEPPSAAELSSIQRYSDGIFVLRNSTRQGIMGQLAFVDFQHLSDDYLVNYTRNVDAVTPAQVQAMAAKYLKLDDMTLVVVGDPAVVTPQLAAFGKNAK